MPQQCYDMVSKTQTAFIIPATLREPTPVRNISGFGLRRPEAKCHQGPWLAVWLQVVYTTSLNYSLMKLQNKNNHVFLRKLLWRFNDILYKEPLAQWPAHHKPPLNKVCFCFQSFAHSFTWNLWRRQRWGLPPCWSSRNTGIWKPPALSAVRTVQIKEGRRNGRTTKCCI